jgi:putative transposase
MPRIPRSQLPESGFFHVYNRGVDRMAIARDDHDRNAWVALLEAAATSFAWKVHVYCLMPNHFHLIVESASSDLSRGMHQLNGLYADRINRRHARTGHLFQGRFGIRVIDGDDDDFGRACAYVYANPVRAKLCESPGAWPWSGIAKRVAPAVPGIRG